MHRHLLPLSIVLAVVTFAGAQQKSEPHPTKAAAKPAVSTAGSTLPSEETVNSFMQQMIGPNASETWKVAEIRPSKAEGLAEVTVVLSGPQGSQSTTFFVTADGQHALLGQLMPFGAHPFEADRTRLEKGISGPARGPADAAVTVVEFSDLQCPHCKELQPSVDKLMTEEKGVRLVFQNFPLPAHDWAEKAAEYADCVSRDSDGAFWKFIQGVYDTQTDITAANADEKLNHLADAAGVKSAEVAACAAKPETAGRVQRSVALGKSVEVTSTPTLFINGRRVNGAPYETLKSLVEFAAKEAK